MGSVKVCLFGLGYVILLFTSIVVFMNMLFGEREEIEKSVPSNPRQFTRLPEPHESPSAEVVERTRRDLERFLKKVEVEKREEKKRNDPLFVFEEFLS